MKKIQVRLNKQSVDNAIKELKAFEKNIKKAFDSFYLECYNYFVNRAKYYVELSDIGNLVKQKINSSWELQKSSNGVKFVNTANIQKNVAGEKQTVPIAVLIEFGVGIVGQSNKHPLSSEVGYEYNIDTDYKDEDGSWTFWTNSKELDIPFSAVEDYKNMGDRGKRGKRMVVTTRGTKGVWYAFNALEDLKLEIPKIWERIKKQVLG